MEYMYAFLFLKYSILSNLSLLFYPLYYLSLPVLRVNHTTFRNDHICHKNTEKYFPACMKKNDTKYVRDVK